MFQQMNDNQSGFWKMCRGGVPNIPLTTRPGILHRTVSGALLLVVEMTGAASWRIAEVFLQKIWENMK